MPSRVSVSWRRADAQPGTALFPPRGGLFASAGPSLDGGEALLEPGHFCPEVLDLPLLCLADPRPIPFLPSPPESALLENLPVSRWSSGYCMLSRRVAMSAWFRRRLSTCCSVFVRVSVWASCKRTISREGVQAASRTAVPRAARDEMARHPPRLRRRGQGRFVRSAGRTAVPDLPALPHTHSPDPLLRHDDAVAAPFLRPAIPPTLCASGFCLAATKPSRDALRVDPQEGTMWFFAAEARRSPKARSWTRSSHAHRSAPRPGSSSRRCSSAKRRSSSASPSRRP